MLAFGNPEETLGAGLEVEEFVLGRGTGDQSYVLRTLAPRFVATVHSSNNPDTNFDADETRISDVIWWDAEPSAKEVDDLLSRALASVLEIEKHQEKEVKQKISDALILAEERFDIERHNFRDIGERLEAQAEELAIIAEEQQLNIEKRIEAEKALRLSEERLQVQVSELIDSEERMAAQAQEMVWLAEDLQAAEQKMKFLANHDALTLLPSRRLCLKYLKDLLAEDRAEGEKTAVFFIDLDGFKAVNDTLGHEAGDAILVGVADRIRALLAPEDMAARIGGDEFIILLKEATSRDGVRVLAETLIEQLNIPFLLDGEEARIGASVGIAFSLDDGTTAEQLLNCADQSMYTIKKKGKNSFGFFSDL
ncbi:GGDEF domain-containing protein [Kiloniella sp. EL199]|uniref:GGDEF domain-containing protein n=1 Tax=Kiloniella sp. EL199 TaxID=2107581 RepID=UPI000EA00E52|nr:GGDEF domain-containing protein [Kiloniella sp. EL199]